MPSRPRVHVSIDVPDLNQGLRFYHEVFGFIEKARPFPSMAIVDANNVTVCLHAKSAGSVPTPTTPSPSDAPPPTRHYQRHWTPVHLDLHVDNFDATLRAVRAAGGTVEREFRGQGPKPVAFCADPFGNGFCLIGDAVTT